MDVSFPSREQPLGQHLQARANALLKDIPVAAGRLQRLQHVRNDSGAVGQRIEFTKMDLRDEIGRLDNRIRELKLSFGMGGFGLTDDDPRV